MCRPCLAHPQSAMFCRARFAALPDAPAPESGWCCPIRLQYWRPNCAGGKSLLPFGWQWRRRYRIRWPAAPLRRCWKPIRGECGRAGGGSASFGIAPMPVHARKPLPRAKNPCGGTANGGGCATAPRRMPAMKCPPANPECAPPNLRSNFQWAPPHNPLVRLPLGAGFRQWWRRPRIVRRDRNA